MIKPPLLSHGFLWIQTRLPGYANIPLSANAYRLFERIIKFLSVIPGFRIQLRRRHEAAELHSGDMGVDEDTWKGALSHEGPVVVTVHGTGDGSPVDQQGNLRWWQRDSKFTQKTQALYGTDQIYWLPFHWSGDNSEIAREAAARKLSELCGALSDRKIIYSLVAHSHGGNIIDLCIVKYRNYMGYSEDCRSIISVGTPFFHRSSRVKIEKFFSLFPLLLAAIYIFASMFRDFDKNNHIAYALCILTPIFLYPLAYLIFTITRAMRSRNDTRILGSRWLPLFSRRDEVIALLSLFGEINKISASQENITSEELAYMKRQKEISNFSIRYANSFAFIFPLLLIICYMLFSSFFSENPFVKSLNESLGPKGSGASNIFMLLGLIYLTIIIVGVIASVWARFTPLNRAAKRLLLGNFKKTSFGDDGDVQLKKVSDKPQYLTTLPPREVNNKDVVAEKMGEAREILYKKLIEARSPEQLINDPGVLFATLMGGIYHNSYFSDQDTIEFTADMLKQAFLNKPMLKKT